MNPLSLNSTANSYLAAAVGTSNSPGAACNKTQTSTFADLLSSSASSTVAGGTSNTSSPNQMLAQLMTSFQQNGLQNEGSSIDPLSVG
jgi:hypothetical protein